MSSVEDGVMAVSDYAAINPHPPRSVACGGKNERSRCSRNYRRNPNRAFATKNNRMRDET